MSDLTSIIAKYSCNGISHTKRNASVLVVLRESTNI